MPDAAIAVHQIFPFFVFVTLSQDSDSLIAKLNRVELVASSREREILLFWSFWWECGPCHLQRFPLGRIPPNQRGELGAGKSKNGKCEHFKVYWGAVYRDT